MDAKAARWVNAAVGVWLFLSAFLWPHTSSQYTNTWLMGIIAVAVALIALGRPGFRYVNTAVGIWLVISAFALPTMSMGTRWNNFIVGLVIGFLSLVGASSGDPSFRRTRTA
jgi:hypothetical protein